MTPRQNLVTVVVELDDGTKIEQVHEIMKGNPRFMGIEYQRAMHSINRDMWNMLEARYGSQKEAE